MQLVIVPWSPGPLISIAPDGPAAGDLRRPTGLPIDLSDLDVRALAASYEDVLAGWPLDDPAVESAHRILLQAASLLRWAPPAGPAEREYVRRRTRAIAALADGDPVGPVAYLRAVIGRL